MKIEQLIYWKDAKAIAKLLNRYNRLKKEIYPSGVYENAYHCHIIKEKNKVIATINYRLLSWWCIEICHLVVAPKYRKGLGRKLIKFLLDKKIRPIYMATVYKDNHISLNLFGNLGFKIISSIKKEYLLIRGK